MANSSSARSVSRIASVTALRMRRSMPGRVQTSPHAPRVMKSWNSAVKSVVPSIARSTWASPSTSRRTVMPAACRASSDGEEDGLIGALEMDVEAVAAVLAGRDEGGPGIVVREAGEHRVGGVGLLLVLEVQPRDDLVQEAAGEDRQVDVRGLLAAVRRGHRAGLEREDRPRALDVGAAAPEAAELAVEAPIGVG